MLSRHMKEELVLKNKIHSLPSLCYRVDPPFVIEKEGKTKVRLTTSNKINIELFRTLEQLKCLTFW